MKLWYWDDYGYQIYIIKTIFIIVNDIRIWMYIPFFKIIYDIFILILILILSSLFLSVFHSTNHLESCAALSAVCKIVNQDMIPAIIRDVRTGDVLYHTVLYSGILYYLILCSTRLNCTILLKLNSAMSYCTVLHCTVI